MAASLPNPRDFKGWEDAFQYPLPAVRKLEQQLRSHAAENREKLRSLVGGSYRDLLGTAERICDMDETMQGIETTLGLTASKCNSGIVEKIFANAAKLNVERTSRDVQRNGLAAQLSLLRNCHSCISQLLRQDGQLYRAAKVLVLGRLVHKMLSQHADVPPLVDGFRNRLASSESMLLKRLNRSFSSPTVDSQQFVPNMCAFSLTTSSTPTDVLYHFLKVRLEAIRNLSTETKHARTNMIRAIQLFKTSLSASHSIFPKRLAEALAKVKLQPLLQDKDVQSVAALHLDIYQRWISDDVRSFTPWPRHDELQRADAQKITKSWIPAATSALKTALEDILQEQDDFEAVLELRTAVLEAHVTSIEQAPGVHLSDLLEIIREALNKRLTELVTLKAGGILALVEQVNTTINNSTTSLKPGHTSLWDLADEDGSLENGSASFKESIRSRLHGYDNVVQTCLETIETWASAIATARARIQSMKERRWEDDILDAGADDDDFDLESQQALLSEEDPRALNKALSRALRDSLVEFGDAISELVKQSGSPERSMFLVRILRELAQETATLEVNFDHAGLSQQLFHTIAISIAQENVTTYAGALEQLVKARHLPAVALWEGHPALPSQPMTSTFKLLRNLTQSMAESGQDLWTPALVDGLKTTLIDKIAASIGSSLEAIQAAPIASTPQALNGVSNGVPVKDESGDEGDRAKAQHAEIQESSESPAPANDDDAEDEPKPLENGRKEDTAKAVPSPPEEINSDQTDSRKAKAQQLLFDINFLERALSPTTQQATISSFKTAAEAALALADLPSDQHERIKKNANDYWRKTYLLFGLLV